MNRYVDAGLFDDMGKGKKILVTTPRHDLSHHQCQRLLRHILDIHPDWITEVRTAEQRWLVRHAWGGSVSIRTINEHNFFRVELGGPYDVVMPQFAQNANFYSHGLWHGEIAHGGEKWGEGIQGKLDNLLNPGGELILE